jgi:hypothetical protein
VKHPGPEVAVAAKEVAVFQDAEERVLNQVLAKFLVPVHPIEETIERSLVPLKEQPKLVEVAVADPAHQGIIGQYVQKQGL